MSAKAPCKLALAGAIILTWNVPALSGQGTSNVNQGPFHAKAANVVEFSFASKGEIEYAGAAISRDGVEFRPIQGVYTSMWSGPSNSEAVIVLIEYPRMGTCNFVFDRPGTYYLKSGIKFRNEHKPSVVFDRAVTVLPTTQADQGFLDGLSDPDLFRQLVGEEFFERKTDAGRERTLSPETADFRALAIIGELLKATREKVTWEIFAGPKWPEERIRLWGDSLSELAKEFPDSSYAPYAVYYAGCCYSAMAVNRAVETIRTQRRQGQREDDFAEGKHRAALLKKDHDCAKAYDAFAFAADRADEYLKPRALYQHAFLRIIAFDLDKADELALRAEQMVPGKGTIGSWISELRPGVAKMRERLKAHRRAVDREPLSKEH